MCITMYMTSIILVSFTHIVLDNIRQDRIWTERGNRNYWEVTTYCALRIPGFVYQLKTLWSRWYCPYFTSESPELGSTPEGTQLPTGLWRNIPHASLWWGPILQEFIFSSTFDFTVPTTSRIEQKLGAHWVQPWIPEDKAEVQRGMCGQGYREC